VSQSEFQASLANYPQSAVASPHIFTKVAVQESAMADRPRQTARAARRVDVNAGGGAAVGVAGAVYVAAWVVGLARPVRSATSRRLTLRSSAGNASNDQLVGGAGRGQLLGGDGDDSHDVADGVRDSITCGNGVDRAPADSIDWISATCENRQ
jgi:hypothetical protein